MGSASRADSIVWRKADRHGGSLPAGTCELSAQLSGEIAHELAPHRPGIFQIEICRKTNAIVAHSQIEEPVIAGLEINSNPAFPAFGKGVLQGI